MTPLRMFRTSGPARTGPFGTLAILEEDGLFRAQWHGDPLPGRQICVTKSQTFSGVYVRFEVYDVPDEPTEENPLRLGRVVVHHEDGSERTWHFHRELPVSAPRIQNVSLIVPVIPQITQATEKPREE